jgi:uncharacterized membrane protein
VDVAANASVNVTMTVTAPSDGKPGACQIVQLTATSTADNTLSVNIDLKAVLGELVDVEMSVKPDSADVDPGEEAEFTITVENEGNGDQTMVLELIYDDEALNGWELGMEDDVKVRAGEYEHVDLSVTPPKDALAGDYDINVSAMPEGMDLHFNETLTVTVNPSYSVEMTSRSETGWDIKSGEYFQLDVVVKNTGNALDTFDIEVDDLPKDWEVQVNDSAESVEIAPGSEYLLTFNITTGGDEGDFDITLKASSDSDPEVGSSLDFKVTLKGEATDGADGEDGTDGGDTTKSSDSSGGSGVNPLVIAVIIAVIVVFGVAAMLMMQKKKRARLEEEEDEAVGEESPQDPTVDTPSESAPEVPEAGREAEPSVDEGE